MLTGCCHSSRCQRVVGGVGCGVATGVGVITYPTHHKKLLILAANFDHAQRKYIEFTSKIPCCSTKLDSSQKNYPARDELAYGARLPDEGRADLQMWSHVTQPAHLSYPFTKSCCRKLGSWLDLSTQSWLRSIRNSFVTFINWRGCC